MKWRAQQEGASPGRSGYCCTRVSHAYAPGNTRRGEGRAGRSSRGASKQSISSNGDLLQQGGSRGAGRRRGLGLPMDARRPVPQPPVGQRRRLRAHQAGVEGRQPGRHDRLPGA